MVKLKTLFFGAIHSASELLSAAVHQPGESAACAARGAAPGLAAGEGEAAPRAAGPELQLGGPEGGGGLSGGGGFGGGGFGPHAGCSFDLKGKWSENSQECEFEGSSLGIISSFLSGDPLRFLKRKELSAGPQTAPKRLTLRPGLRLRPPALPADRVRRVEAPWQAKRWTLGASGSYFRRFA